MATSMDGEALEHSEGHHHHHEHEHGHGQGHASLFAMGEGDDFDS